MTAKIKTDPQIAGRRNAKFKLRVRRTTVSPSGHQRRRFIADNIAIHSIERASTTKVPSGSTQMG